MLAALFGACNQGGGTGGNTGGDTTIKPVTTEDLKKAKPAFPGYKEENVYIGDTVRYLRVVLNNDELVKTWIVFFDKTQHKWVTLTWMGKGAKNRILVDTVINDQTGIGYNHDEEEPGIYCARTEDSGKTWLPMDMSRAPLSCKHPDLHKMKIGQLVVSNDFARESHLPSIAYIWQWNHEPPPLSGEGLASQLDFSSLCDAAQELPYRATGK